METAGPDLEFTGGHGEVLYQKRRRRAQNLRESQRIPPDLYIRNAKSDEGVSGAGGAVT